MKNTVLHALPATKPASTEDVINRLRRELGQVPGIGLPLLGVCNGFQVLTEAGLLPGVLMRNADAARTLVARGAGAIQHDAHGPACACRHALDHALITAPAARDAEMVQRLQSIAGRVL
mgnify:CR=1 FL=1